MWQNIAFYFKLDIFETLLSNPGLKPLIPNPLGQTPTQDLNLKPYLGLDLIDLSSSYNNCIANCSLQIRGEWIWNWECTMYNVCK